jgi:hypothetical protein
MVLIGHNPRLTFGNNLDGLCDVVNEQQGPKAVVE